ncbi:MAG: hypothetical protein GY798_17210 [Hyphomicrobiales bacterium]|nr:hypothetical protein [Hyphomicrobiales bacterium]
MTTALANYVGGWLAEVSAIPAGTAKAAELEIYDRAFLTYGIIALAVGAALLVLIPTLRRLIGSAGAKVSPSA